MTAEYIYKCARATVQVYGTGEPEDIFRTRGAVIKEKAPAGLSGMICMKDSRLIVYPPHASYGSKRRISMAHMLGHAILHKDRLCAGECFEDCFFSGGGSCAEKEADIFAAEILIDDEKIKDMDRFGFTEGQIAAHLGALRALASCKIYSMRCRGISVCQSSYRADFMRRCDIDILM